MTNRLRARIYLGIGLCAVLLALVAVSVSIGADRFLESSTWVAHSHHVQEDIERAYATVKDAESAQRAYLLTGRVEFEEEFLAGIPRARAAIEALAEQVQDNPEQTARAKNFLDLVEQRLHAATDVAMEYRSHGLDAARKALEQGQGTRLMAQIARSRGDMEAAEQSLLATRHTRSSSDAVGLKTYTYSGLALSLLLLGVVAARMLREVAQREVAEERTALANADLQASVRDLRDLGEQTSALSHYAGMLQSCRSAEEAIGISRDALLRLLPELGGAIYLVRASQDLAERIESWGPHAANSGALLPPQDCWALRRGQTYEIADVHNATRCAHVTLPAADKAASTLCIPLVAHGETMGFIYFSGTGDSAARKRTLAVAAAEQLSLALSNLRLQDSLRIQSIRDPLTGLFNRRYLEESLDRELARCGRRDLPLSVLMLDLDHFKRFNDTHGHDGGDALLTSAGRLLQSLCRTEDIACRYGGEEFTLILPEMDQAAANLRSEQLRAAIEAMQVQHLRQTLSPVTASIGVAMYPQDSALASDLLRAADNALYRAKNEGRNRVVHA